LPQCATVRWMRSKEGEEANTHLRKTYRRQRAALTVVVVRRPGSAAARRQGHRPLVRAAGGPDGGGGRRGSSWVGWWIGGPQRALLSIMCFLSCSVQRRAERAGLRGGAACPVSVALPRPGASAPLHGPLFYRVTKSGGGLGSAAPVARPLGPGSVGGQAARGGAPRVRGPNAFPTLNCRKVSPIIASCES
jgi:hypothetical protein